MTKKINENMYIRSTKQVRVETTETYICIFNIFKSDCKKNL